MSYVCDWSLELPVIVGGRIVAYCPDIECILALDEKGDLSKVGFREHGKPKDPPVWLHSGTVFRIAHEALANNRDHIMELCEIPSDVRFSPRERPEYTGPEYHPINI
tara:strand:+ start:69 stop:389 length:321 start_codon:yes stop_codon:yes gene_type:complete